MKVDFGREMNNFINSEIRKRGQWKKEMSCPKCAMKNIKFNKLGEGCNRFLMICNVCGFQTIYNKGKNGKDNK